MGDSMLEATADARPILILFSQQADALKDNSLYKTQNFQPFSDITNGSRDMGNFMQKATAYAHP